MNEPADRTQRDPRTGRPGVARPSGLGAAIRRMVPQPPEDEDVIVLRNPRPGWALAAVCFGAVVVRFVALRGHRMWNTSWALALTKIGLDLATAACLLWLVATAYRWLRYGFVWVAIGERWITVVSGLPSRRIERSAFAGFAPYRSRGGRDGVGHTMVTTRPVGPGMPVWAAGADPVRLPNSIPLDRIRRALAEMQRRHPVAVAPSGVATLPPPPDVPLGAGPHLASPHPPPTSSVPSARWGAVGPGVPPPAADPPDRSDLSPTPRPPRWAGSVSSGPQANVPDLPAAGATPVRWSSTSPVPGSPGNVAAREDHATVTPGPVGLGIVAFAALLWGVTLWFALICVVSIVAPYGSMSAAQDRSWSGPLWLVCTVLMAVLARRVVWHPVEITPTLVVVPSMGWTGRTTRLDRASIVAVTPYPSPAVVSQRPGQYPERVLLPQGVSTRRVAAALGVPLQRLPMPMADARRITAIVAILAGVGLVGLNVLIDLVAAFVRTVSG